MAKITEVCEVTRSKLIPYERNAKIHCENQVQRIADSIKEFGFVSPCLIDRDFNIIAGHGRVMAAELLGIEKVPCVFIEGLTDEQRRAYILADNRLTELGEWDMELVDDELAQLNFDGFDVSLTGFEFNENNDDLGGERESVKFEDNISVLIKCESEEEAEYLYNEMTERGYTCIISTL